MTLKIKKKIVVDGVDIEVEGTPEEVAEYEKSIRKGEQKTENAKRKKELLKDEIRRMVQEEVAKQPPSQQIHWHWYPANQWLPSPCAICGQYNCNRNHITWTISGDSTTLSTSQEVRTTNTLMVS